MDLGLQKLYGYFVQYGLQVFAAVVILVVGRWGAKIISNFVDRVLSRAGIHRTLAVFLRHLAFYSLLTFTVIAALNKLGVETTSFIAVLGAASLAVGLALQGTLSNFAAGIMIILFSPFEVGDMIDAAGAQGLVEEIQIFSTVLITTDKKRVIVPNAKITGDKITVFPRDMPITGHLS